MLQPIQAGGVAQAASPVRPVAEVSAKPVLPAEASRQTERVPDSTELGNVVADLNKVAQANAQGVRFSIDEDTGRTVVKVVDTQTDQVLRQIPSVEALKLWRSMEQMQGAMLRDKA